MSKTEARPKVTIFCDGGCKPNPGAGAWAAILQFGDKEKELTGGEAETTNNRMELTAVTKALEELKVPCDVTVVTDSEYLANAFRQKWIESWKRKGWINSQKQPVKNKDLWVELDALVAKHHVTWEWTRGHSGHWENERCDELATQTRIRMFGH
ncbi:MAG TPA: ribonuclease HI [Planctomycetota bacterium]|nr:ribonuclease HI [Planctomycetota bacterium]